MFLQTSGDIEIIEVFKTNVTEQQEATLLLHHIHKNFINYSANFDLEDCDNILRIKSKSGWIEPSFVIKLLNQFGFDAEVLPDELPFGNSPNLSSPIPKTYHDNACQSNLTGKTNMVRLESYQNRTQ